MANIKGESANFEAENEENKNQEVMEVDWAFGSTKNEGIDVGALTFIWKYKIWQ